MILLQKQGCEVVSVYFTSGERGIKGVSLDEAASIRRQELIEACKVMGVKYRLMTQIDGQSEINAERYKEMIQVIEEEKPDVVFTHWPIELHRDHRNCIATTGTARHSCWMPGNKAAGTATCTTTKRNWGSKPGISHLIRM